MVDATTIPIQRVPSGYGSSSTPGSLCWDGEMLTDWSLGHRYHLDGRSEKIGDHYGEQFNGVASHPAGEYACIYERTGTKGLLLHKGKTLREINRSYYLADSFEFPVVLFRLPDGRDVMAHCPEKYDLIEIDDILTGERLTSAPERVRCDLLHSRFVVNPSSTLLLGSGWLWHPIELFSVYDIGMALANPGSLDNVRGMAPLLRVEVCSAAFCGDSSIIFCTTNEAYDMFDDDDETEEEKGPLKPLMLAHYELQNNSYIRTTRIGEIAGTIMPLNERYVAGLYDHPKVFDMFTGEIVHRLPEIKTGRQEGAIFGVSTAPPMAFDPERQRFAVVTEAGVVVVQYRIA